MYAKIECLATTCSILYRLGGPQTHPRLFAIDDITLRNVDRSDSEKFSPLSDGAITDIS